MSLNWRFHPVDPNVVLVACIRIEMKIVRVTPGLYWRQS